MPENLLCPKQKATTPAFREGWDRVFNSIPIIESNRPDRNAILVNIDEAEFPLEIQPKVPDGEGYQYYLKNT